MDSAAPRSIASDQASRRISSLDGLRAVAILGVLIGHGAHIAGAPAWMAKLHVSRLGVKVFFALSGYLITRLLVLERQRTGSIALVSFFRRRCWRLLPALAAYLAVVAALDLLSPAVHEPALSWLTSVTFTKNFYAPTWITGHLWSLSVEEQFYIVWPFVMWLFAATLQRNLALLAIVSAPLARLALELTGHRGFANVSFFTNVDYLLWGSLAGIHALRANQGARASQSRVASIVVGAALVAFACEQGLVLGRVASVMLPSVQALATGVLVLYAAELEKGALFAFLNARPVVYLGRISYSVYLVQEALLVPKGFYGASDWWVSYPLALPLSIFAGALSYELVEKPGMSRNRKPVQPQASVANVRAEASL